MAVLSYHEQEMIENTKKLRKLIRELRLSAPTFFAELNLVLLRGQELLMLMI